MSPATCRRCDCDLTGPRIRKNRRARGLCDNCYYWCRRNNAREDYPLLKWTSDQLLAEWNFLAAQGTPTPIAAQRLGVQFGTLERAYYRAKKAGHPLTQRPFLKAS